MPPFRRLAVSGLLPLFAFAHEVAPDSEPTPVLDAYVTHARPETAPPGGLSSLRSAAGRSATAIPSATLQTHAVTRMEDLAALVPGSVAAPPYGITGVPLMRGDFGDAAWNGQRRAYNRNMFPVSFNAVESVETLAGAAPIVLGPTAGTGGFVNLLTKQPRFHPATTLGVSYGSWRDLRAQLDTTGPLSSRLAYRLSLEFAEAGSYFRLAGERSLSAYAAVAYRPASGARWDFNVEGYAVDFSEITGTNRPTQALIDRGEYLTGSSVQNGGTGPYFGNTFIPTGTTRIDGSQIILSPGDASFARTWTAQLTGTIDTPDRQFALRTYFESVTAEKFGAYSFTSHVPESLTLEHRIEVREDRRFAGLDHALLWGAALRGERRTSYVDFFNQVLNAWDLTLDPSTYRLPSNQFFGVRPIPGRPGRSAVSGARYPASPTAAISQTLRSRLVSGGIFAEDTIPLPGRLTAILSARLDALHVDAEDPLPAPGFPPVGDSLRKLQAAAGLGLAWRASSHATLHATAHRASAFEPSSSSGGFGLTANRLPASQFENASELLEMGARFRTADNRAAGSIAAFTQRRIRSNSRVGLPDRLRVRGLEAAAEFRHGSLRLQGNAAWLDARYEDGPLPGGIATFPSFDPQSPSGTFGPFPRGEHRLPGLPRWTARAFAEYTREGWGLRAAAALQGEQSLDLLGHVVIPAQGNFDVGAYWRHAGWELAGDLLNLTDSFNWRPTHSPLAGGDLVTRELPRHWRLTIRRTF